MEEENKARRQAIQSQLEGTKTPPIYGVEVDPKVLENQVPDPQLDPEARKRLLQTLEQTSEVMPATQAPAPQPVGQPGAMSNVLLEALMKALPPDQLQKLLLAALTGQAGVGVPAPALQPAPTLDAPDILENTLNERRDREKQTSVEQQNLDDNTRREVLKKVTGSDDTIDFLTNMGGFR